MTSDLRADPPTDTLVQPLALTGALAASLLVASGLDPAATWGVWAGIVAGTGAAAGTLTALGRSCDTLTPTIRLHAALTTAALWVIAAGAFLAAMVRAIAEVQPLLAVAGGALVPLFQARSPLGQALFTLGILVPSCQAAPERSLRWLRACRPLLRPPVAARIELELLRDLGDLDAAVDVAVHARAVSRTPDAIAMVDLHESAIALDRAVASDPPDADRLALARALARAALHATPDDPIGLCLSAEIALREGRASEAFALARRGSDLAEKGWLARPWLPVWGATLRAWALWELGQHVAARELSRRVEGPGTPPRVTRVATHVHARMALPPRIDPFLSFEGPAASAHADAATTPPNGAPPGGNGGG